MVRLLETVLGNVFLWAGEPLYGVYDDGSELYGLSPLRDQGLAGTVMMIEGSLVTHRRDRVAVPALGRGERAAAAADRARRRRADRARAVRYGRGEELSDPR